MASRETRLGKEYASRMMLNFLCTRQNVKAASSRGLTAGAKIKCRSYMEPELKRLDYVRHGVIVRYACLTILSIAFTSLAYALPLLGGPVDAQSELGTIFNSGNSHSMNVNGKLMLEYEQDRWHEKSFFESQYGNSEGKRTEERYLANLEIRYRFSNFSYFYGNGEAIHQHFKPYDKVYSEGVGVGRRFIETENFSLDLQGGPGGRHSREAGSRFFEHNFIFESTTTAKYRISKYTSFLAEISSKSGKANTFAKSKVSLTTKFDKNLGLKFAYVVEYNSTLPDDSDLHKHFDSTSSLTLVYAF